MSRLLTSGAIAIAITAATVIGGAGVAVASHQFSDVPDDSQFHADIDWLVDRGIAAGYDDGTFRPTTAVSRQAMARFLKKSTEAGSSFAEVTSFSSFYTQHTFITKGRGFLANVGRPSVGQYVLRATRDISACVATTSSPTAGYTAAAVIRRAESDTYGPEYDVVLSLRNADGVAVDGTASVAVVC